MGRRGPSKHLKRINAPSHWMLDKLGGIFVSRLSFHPQHPLSFSFQKKQNRKKRRRRALKRDVLETAMRVLSQNRKEKSSVVAAEWKRAERKRERERAREREEEEEGEEENHVSLADLQHASFVKRSAALLWLASEEKEKSRSTKSEIEKTFRLQFFFFLTLFFFFFLLLVFDCERQ